MPRRTRHALLDRCKSLSNMVLQPVEDLQDATTRETLGPRDAHPDSHHRNLEGFEHVAMIEVYTLRAYRSRGHLVGTSTYGTTSHHWSLHPCRMVPQSSSPTWPWTQVKTRTPPMLRRNVIRSSKPTQPRCFTSLCPADSVPSPPFLPSASRPTTPPPASPHPCTLSPASPGPPHSSAHRQWARRPLL